MHVRADEISIVDAAQVFDVDRVTIWRWCHSGLLAARRRDRNYFPKLAAVEEIMAQRRRVARLKAGGR